MLLEIVNMYGAEIIGTVLVTLFGVFGMIFKEMVAKYLDTDTKRAMAKVIVHFVEQTCKELHGEAKLKAALDMFAKLLNEKGIKASVTEMKVLLEAAVAEFNEVFKKE